MAPNHAPETLQRPEACYFHQPDTEPIPGYRLIQPLGQGGFGEVWKCEAPGGLLKAIKFVQGRLHALDQNPPAEEELRAIQRVKAIRHPFILSMERVEVVDGELVIVLELADRSLADVLRAEQKAGRVGISRESLLAYLREAAEALDLMHTRYALQHLDIKPQNLFLLSNHVKVGDFGLVSSCGAGAGGLAPTPALGAITPLYASPEVFQGAISPHCDQYSLAIVYQELLTGTLPYKGKNGRQLLMQHLQGQPNLQPLPAGDRELVARALSKIPTDRFPCCSDFVQALLAGLTEVVSSTIFSDPGSDAETARKDTRRTPSIKTVRMQSIPVRPPGVVGVEIGELVSRTPLTEVWKAVAADGSPRIVKVLFSITGSVNEGVDRLTALHHPALTPIDVLDHVPGRLVLSTVPGDRSLRDLLMECQAHGLRGIPRDRLLCYLKTVAEVVGFFGRQGIYHLGLNSRNLVLQSDRLLIGDFGLAHLLWMPAGKAIASLNTRYSAPELFQRQVGPACDQYSVALIYHEMLTGQYPAATAAPRKGEPAVWSLDRLPVSDRSIVARALSLNPLERWESVAEFIAALEAAAISEGDAEFSVAGVEPVKALPPVAALREKSAAPTAVLQSRFGSNLTAEVIRQRLEGFRQQWQGNAVVSEPRRMVFHMQTPSTFWQRWRGIQPGLEIHLQIGSTELDAPAGVQTLTEVRMDIRPHDCTREQSGELLKAVGPLMVESVRTHLRLNPYGRLQERVVWHHPLHLCSVLPDGTLGPSIECQGKDISLNGIGFYLPGQLPSSHVMLLLPKTDQTPRMEMPARIVRVQGCGDGWYEVGAALLPPHEMTEDEREEDREDDKASGEN